ncbi:hypothetical protein KR054_009060, partial [Drosophila jambulina]
FREICRVCLETSEGMANIFGSIGILDRRISIADMISHCTGYRVSRGDPYPKFICESCKQDAINAYEIKQIYETSHMVFCQMENDIKGDEDLLEEETPYKVKKGFEKDTIEIDETKTDDYHGRVKNEPLEEDVFEEDQLHILDSEVDQLDFQVKTEELKECAQKDDQRPNDKPELPHKCSYCQKPFLHKCNLQLHIRTHTGERPFKCTYCPKAFALNGTLQKHIRTHTGERPYKCSQCDSSFKTIAPLQTHIRTHTGERPYKCSECPKAFSQNRHLQDHFRIHTGERPFKCSQCQATFGYTSSLRKHIQTHTGERPHKCPQKSCNASFSRIDSLQEHTRSHAGHAEERAFKCLHCQKGFTSKRYLRIHIKTHT